MLFPDVPSGVCHAACFVAADDEGPVWNHAAPMDARCCHGVAAVLAGTERVFARAPGTFHAVWTGGQGEVLDVPRAVWMAWALRVELVWPVAG